MDKGEREGKKKREEEKKKKIDVWVPHGYRVDIWRMDEWGRKLYRGKNLADQDGIFFLEDGFRVRRVRIVSDRL
jgi:hypothetical protein